MGFIITIFAWGGSEALRNLAIAYVVTGAWGHGLNVIAQDIGWGRIGHEFERLVASPVALQIYFTGVALGTSPFMLVELIPASILASIVGMDMVSFIELRLAITALMITKRLK